MSLINKMFKLRYQLLALIFSVVFIYMNSNNPMSGLTISVALLGGYIFLKNPLAGLVLLIMFSPYLGIAIFNKSISQIPGLKLHTLLALMVVGVMLIKKDVYRIDIKIIFFICGMLSIFIISVIRSIDYMHLFTEADVDLVRFINSYLIKQVLIFMVFILIALFIRSRKEIGLITNACILGVMFLSIYIIYLYVFMIPNKTDFEFVRDSFQEVIGLHGNNLATYYILTFPMLLATAINKKKWYYFAIIALALAVIGILYSRTAYMLVTLSTVTFFILTKRYHYLPYLFLVGALIFVSLLGTTIFERIMYGFDSGDANAISAGRTDDLWLPMIQELISDPRLLLLGNGICGVVNTKVYNYGMILQVTHIHNMYLDIIIDSGIFSLMFYLGYFAYFLLLFYKTFRYSTNTYYKDILASNILSIINFMISGFSGRSFFPTIANSYLWVIISTGLVIHIMEAHGISEKKQIIGSI